MKNISFRFDRPSCMLITTLALSGFACSSAAHPEVSEASTLLSELQACGINVGTYTLSGTGPIYEPSACDLPPITEATLQLRGSQVVFGVDNYEVSDWQRVGLCSYEVSGCRGEGTITTTSDAGISDAGHAESDGAITHGQIAERYLGLRVHITANRSGRLPTFALAVRNSEAMCGTTGQFEATNFYAASPNDGGVGASCDLAGTYTATAITPSQPSCASWRAPLSVEIGSGLSINRTEFDDEPASISPFCTIDAFKGTGNHYWIFNGQRRTASAHVARDADNRIVLRIEEDGCEYEASLVRTSGTNAGALPACRYDAPAICGDGVCEASESCSRCAGDCGCAVGSTCINDTPRSFCAPDTCMQDSDCTSAGPYNTCLRGYRGGTCTRACQSDRECGAGYCYGGENGTRGCVATCRANYPLPQCGSNRYCRSISQSVGVCLPN